MTITLTLPLPHRGLRPNSMLKWQAKFGLTKQAREAARRATFLAIKDIECEEWLLTGYTLKVYFSTKRHWDELNLVSAFKAQEDGIADAVKQNDRNFKILGVERYTDTKNPRLEVILQIEELL